MRQLAPALVSATHAVSHPSSAKTDDRFGLALDGHGSELLPAKASPAARRTDSRHVDRVRAALRHQPRREIDGVAEARERLPPLVPVRAAAKPAVCDPDLDVRSTAVVAPSSRNSSAAAEARAASSSWASGGPNTHTGTRPCRRASGAASLPPYVAKIR